MTKEIQATHPVIEILIDRQDLFRNFFNLPLVGAAITSRQKGWIAVNDRTCEILGFTREELFKKTWADITHPEDLQADIDLFQKMLRGEINGYSLEKRFIRHDGNVVWTLLSGGRSVTADINSEYFYVQLLDISEKKHAEIELISARYEAEAALASLEIANKKLKIYAEQQIELSRHQERERLLKDIHDGFGSHLASLRISAQKGAIKPNEFESALTSLYSDLHLVVDTLSLSEVTLPAALADMRHRLNKYKITEHAELLWNVRLEALPNLPTRTVLHLLRIIQEALNNAIRHSSASQITIGAIYDAQKSLLLIAVGDNGIGLPAIHHAGRGFYNMKQRLREIDGALQITPNTEGVGTVVTVELRI